MRTNKVIVGLINVLSSNLTVMFLGIIISMYLPVILDIEGYGYFQLYLLYSGYLGIFMLGILDGMNLKYSGTEYDDLNKVIISKYFYITLFISSIFMLISILICMFFVSDINKKLVFIFVSINILLFNCNGYFSHLNQLSFRFKNYSIGILLERLLFVMSFIPLILYGKQDYVIYIIINVICRIITLIYNVYTTWDVIKLIDLNIENLIEDFIDSMKVGLPVMLSSFIGMLILGSPRILVEKTFGIEVFALFSFSMSILSMGIQVIAAIATVLYPILRKKQKHLYDQASVTFSNIVTWIGILILIAYYPIYMIIQIYIPKYNGILEYLHLLIPLMIFQCKNNIVVNTFYKALRFENILIKNNIKGFLLCCISTTLALYMSKNIKVMIIFFVLSYALWTNLSLNKIKNLANWKMKRYEYVDFIIIIVFIILNSSKSILYSSILFILFLILYISFLMKVYIRDIKFIKEFCYD